jgi:dihydrofolate reductase
MKAIAAMDINRGMGFRGKLPWRLPADFKWFKQKTLETKKLVMGRDTFQTVGTLKDRFTYVLTSDAKLIGLPSFSNYRYVGSDFFETESHDDMWLCGGAKTYTWLLPYCTEVYVTHVLDEYESDTYMPLFEKRFINQEIILETKDFWIVKYSAPFEYK